MRTAQHLPEGEIERAEITLAIPVGRRLLMCVAMQHLVRVRIVLRMPRRMYERTLLRNQQQEHA